MFRQLTAIFLLLLLAILQTCQSCRFEPPTDGLDTKFKTCSKTPEIVDQADAAKLRDHMKKVVGDNILMSSSNDRVLKAQCSNGLVGGFITAYNNHYNIVVRPENFWIAILTQFSQFVNANSEKLRNTFVSFKGKKTLTVRASGTLQTFPYDSMALQMTNQIADNLKNASVRDWILPSFSTTTANDKIVSSVVMMATMQSYFSYKFSFMCGIPHVTLLGKTDDYRDLLKRINLLPEFDAGTGLMVKWHKMLKPIAEELIRASQGEHDSDFWSRVCSLHAFGSGSTWVDGWITAFAVFDDHGRWQGGHGKYPKLDTMAIPSGVVSAPVTVEDAGGEYETTMYAGSFAVDVADSTSIKPRLDWCIALKSAAPS